MHIAFDQSRELLKDQFSNIHWDADSGLSLAELENRVLELEQTDLPRAIIKAKTFALICEQGQLAVDKADIFQDKLLGGGIMAGQRKRWEAEAKERYLARETAEMQRAWKEFGAYKGAGDYGHTSPNSRLMLSIGLTGLLERVELAAKRDGLSQKQREFYDSCRIVLQAVITVAKRLAEAIEPYNAECSMALQSITNGAPRNSYEAMQLLVLYFFLHEYIGGTRVRTLGRLDALLYPFYQRDLANGTFTKGEIKEMLKFFLHKFWVAKVPFDLPFCLGGMDADGGEVTNEVSYLIVETYNELNIYSPKIHIRVSEKTPKDFVLLVLSCIRGGNSSFVFVNDTVAIKGLTRVGIDPQNARNYVPIGCYEPAVWGVELGCTGNGGINLPKAVELVFNNGRDLKSGALCGLETGRIETFGAFVKAVKEQIAYMTRKAMEYVVRIEGHYDEINPDPLLSCQYDQSVERGVDVYEGGAKYNSSSLYFYSLASLVDAICAVKKLVFEQGLYTFDAFGEVLRSNWQGHEQTRAKALHLPEKYGNGHPIADAFTVEFADFCADLVNNSPNGRGGVFKASLFSVDHYLHTSKRTMATPDGRLAGEPLSKNMCATVGMDKNGVTALIGSVTRFDHSKFPNGSVQDIVLHPSAVAGEKGLDAFYTLLTTYFRLGGFAMHGNTFDAADLRAAQADPAKYQTLQVRVCGWNAYFVDLSRTEQEAFIRQAEGCR